MSEDRLRPLWHDLDLDATERAFQRALEGEATEAGRADVLSQLARVELRRGELVAAHELLDRASELASGDPVAAARVLLERGRLTRRSEGDEHGLVLLEQAYAAALAAEQHFMAADAAHSCALAGDMVAWTARGLELTERFPAARYWRGTLLINLGDWQWERAEYEKSLASFRGALPAREGETRNPWLTEYARYGVARALRSLGRRREAVALLEQVVRWLDMHQLDSSEAREARAELAAAREVTD